MQKKFITNLALLLFLNLLIKPFWILGIDRSVQNAVDADSYGTYFALFNFSFLFNILLDLGITNFNNRNIAQNNHLLNKHVSSIILLRVMLGLLYMVVTLIIAVLLGYTLDHLKFLLVLGFNQILISFILYLRSNIAGLHLFKTDSFISVLDRLIMISICALLLWGGVSDKPFQIEWYIYAQTAAYLITALITLFIVIDRARLKKLKWNPAFFMMILKQSYPFAILVLLMTFYNRIDTVMIERILSNGAAQSSIYASAYRLLDAANMIAYLFAGLLLPMFSKMIKERSKLDELVKLSFSLLIVPSTIVAFVSFFYNQEIMELLYDKHTGESAEVFRVLMFCFIPVSTTYIFGTLLTSNGNLRELNIMASIGMLFNIMVNFIMIRKFEAVGAAVTSFVTQLLTAVFQVIISQMVFRFKVNYSYLLRLFLFIGGVVGLGSVMHYLPVDWTFQVLLFAGVAGLWAFITRILSVKGLYSILKYG